MARKPKPPLPELQIESLSTGKLVGLDDEFAGQPIPQPNAKPRRPSAEHKLVERAQRIAIAQHVLAQAGWYGELKPKKVCRPFKRRM